MKQKKSDFILIVESNRGLIRSLCNAYFTGIEDQKDIFQDIILQLWKSFETFRGESEISTWIYRVSLNTILAKIRKEKNQACTQPISDTEIPLWHARADDERELLNLVLQSLNELDKAIVLLYLEGYKNKEISQILNITLTNVTTRLSRVKAHLKARFKTQHYELK